MQLGKISKTLSYRSLLTDYNAEDKRSAVHSACLQITCYWSICNDPSWSGMALLGGVYIRSVVYAEANCICIYGLFHIEPMQK